MKLEKEILLCNYNDSTLYIINPFTKKENGILYNMIGKKAKLTLEVLEVKNSILNEKEKKYLNDVISPFKEKVISISKTNFHDNYFIVISVNGKSRGSFSNHTLPIFDEQDSYIGMELNKGYTLEELGL